MSNIFELIKIMCNYNVEKKEVEREIIEARAIARGFNKEIIDNTIINYQNLGVLRVKDNVIKLIDWFLLFTLFCFALICFVLLY